MSKKANGTSPDEAPLEWAPGHVIPDDFVVDGVIGTGGKGVVYLVHSFRNSRLFAVKRARVHNETERASLLAELQTWIDLPEHPNILPCRFFRTEGDEVLIFADLADKGSLRAWMDSRRLYEGGHPAALSRILNFAIQSAWGLHCLHELGLVHQDVKPDNILMAEDAAALGVRAKIADFGLARISKSATHTPASGPSQQGPHATLRGLTPQYSSPEQLRAAKMVTRQTDVWSWGVSVMEMFTGKLTWTSGAEASNTLKALVKAGPKDADIPRMPPEMVELLQKCFQNSLRKRWESLEQVVGRLKVIYQKITKQEYPVALDRIERKTMPHARIGERRTRHGDTWGDPRAWLEYALEEDGCDPAEAATFMAQPCASRQGHLMADIAVYDKAREIFERLVAPGGTDLELDLANVCDRAANLHLMVGDHQGGLALHDRAIEILEKIVERDDCAANLPLKVGDHQGGLALHAQAIEILEKFVKATDLSLLADELARFYSNKAMSLCDLGEWQSAIELQDKAIAILQAVIKEDESRDDLVDNLMLVMGAKADALAELGNNQAALTLYDPLIAHYEQSVNEEGQSDLEDRLCTIYVSKAVTLDDLGNPRGALELYDKALAIIEPLFRDEKRADLAESLASVYTGKALTLRNLNNFAEALAVYDMALAIRKCLMTDIGRRELAEDLAETYAQRAATLRELGDHSGAREQYDRAIEILEPLTRQDGRSDLYGDWASAMGLRAIELIQLGETERGNREAQESIVALTREVKLTERADLKAALDWITKTVAGATLTAGAALAPAPTSAPASVRPTSAGYGYPGPWFRHRAGLIARVKQLWAMRNTKI